MALSGRRLVAVLLASAICFSLAVAQDRPQQPSSSVQSSNSQEAGQQEPLSQRQPSQIQVTLPTQLVVKTEQTKSFAEVWGPIIAPAATLIAALVAGFFGVNVVSKQIRASKESLKTELESELSKHSNDLEKIETQYRNQLQFEIAKDERRKKSLLSVLAVEIFGLKRRASVLFQQTQMPFEKIYPTGPDGFITITIRQSPHDEELKRLSTPIPEALNTSWSDLALLNDPVLLSDITGLKQLLQRLGRRLDYVLSQTPERRAIDTVSVGYIAEIPDLFKESENTAVRLLVKLKNTSDDLSKQITNLEDHETDMAPAASSKPRPRRTEASRPDSTTVRSDERLSPA
jgi:hypothetical protein